MLFLLGVKAHPVIRILLGAAIIAVGLGLGMKTLAIIGIPMLVWGGYSWFQRSRVEARQQEALLHKSGAAR